MNNRNIYIIGADLSSNGGIASVIKTYYKEYKNGNYQFDLFFLKTNYYKDKPKIYSIILFVKVIPKFIYNIFSKKIGILHIHCSAYTSFFRKSLFVILGKIFNKKIIIHIHASRFYSFFLTENKFLKVYIYFIFNLCNVVIVLCDDWEIKLKKEYPKINVKKIANPIILSRENISLSTFCKQELDILFVGFLIESKGIKDLLKVGLKLKETNISNVKIKIAGKGDLEAFLIKFIENHDLSNIIEYIGWADEQKKRDLYAKSDVLILPSYNEGMPISILEAMSYGLPILSTKIAGIPDVISDNENGFLFEPGDIDEIYKKIIYLKTNKDILEKIKVRNLEKIKNFSVEKVFGEIVKIYNEVIYSE